MTIPRAKKTADFNLRMKPRLRSRLDAVATRLDRSVASIVTECLEAHLPVLETEIRRRQHGTSDGRNR